MKKKNHTHTKETKKKRKERLVKKKIFLNSDPIVSTSVKFEVETAFLSFN